MATDYQPIITGIQAVGAVQMYYRYNNPSGLIIPRGWVIGEGNDSPTKAGTYFAAASQASGIKLGGFRLDSDFFSSDPQIDSSYTVPLLGGGAVSFTNNNRSGSLTFSCTRVSTPQTGEADTADVNTAGTAIEGTKVYTSNLLAMLSREKMGMGLDDGTDQYYDMVLIAQLQQGQPGGDSWGARLSIQYDFNGMTTLICFIGCTVARVRPLAMTGNGASDYAVTMNYLNWFPHYWGNGKVGETFPASSITQTQTQTNTTESADSTAASEADTDS